MQVVATQNQTSRLEVTAQLLKEKLARAEEQRDAAQTKASALETALKRVEGEKRLLHGQLERLTAAEATRFETRVKQRRNEALPPLTPGKGRRSQGGGAGAGRLVARRGGGADTERFRGEILRLKRKLAEAEHERAAENIEFEALATDLVAAERRIDRLEASVAERESAAAAAAHDGAVLRGRLVQAERLASHLEAQLGVALANAGSSPSAIDYAPPTSLPISIAVEQVVAAGGGGGVGGGVDGGEDGEGLKAVGVAAKDAGGVGVGAGGVDVHSVEAT